MKTLPVIRRLAYCLLFVFLCCLSFISIRQIRAQEEWAVLGPELRDASFIPVSDLKVGDWVFVKGEEGLVPEQITKLKYKQESVEVYNLSVDGEETFFANDFAVHNKSNPNYPTCKINIAPRILNKSVEVLRTAGYLEAWSLGGCTSATGGCTSYSKNNFKNLFTPHNNEGWGNQFCLFGKGYNGCLYPCNEAECGLHQCDRGDGKIRCCDLGVSYGGCCNSQKNCGTSCNCTYVNSATNTPAVPNCEYICGSFRIGHTASDRIRFRVVDNPCDGNGCGASIKVTAPSGYLIHSIEMDAYVNFCPGIESLRTCSGGVGFTRGMTRHLSDTMRPQEAFFGTGKTYNSRVVVKMQLATTHFFIYSNIFCERGDYETCMTRGMLWKDHIAELSNIKLNLIKINNVVGTEVEVVNNSLTANYPNENCDDTCAALQNGTIILRNPGKLPQQIDFSTISNTHDSPKFSYIWDLGPGNSTVDATVIQNETGYTDTCSDTINVIPQTGTITGRVFQNEDGRCKDEAEPPPEVDWTVECQIGGTWVKAREDSRSQFTCVDSGGNEKIPYGSYNIRLTPPENWQAIDCGGFTTLRNVVLNGPSAKIDPPFYIWKGIPSWFQTEEGDVYGGGGVYSMIPTGEYFCLRGEGGTPGVVSYEGDFDFKRSTGKGDDRVSETGWLTESDLSRSQKTYEYFYKLLGSPTEDNFESLSLISEDGVYYQPEGIEINNNFSGGGIKAVVLVNGDVNINTDITIPEDGSSLVVIADGTITFANSVARADGIYLAETISTGTGSLPFFGYGSFVASNFILGRDDEGDLVKANPYESFYYRPDLMINSLEDIWIAPYTWQEIAP